MLGLYVSVPIACFRKPYAREFLETELIPPPSTCYGFLLSLVGETDRDQHIGCRVTPALLDAEPRTSTVLRTIWRLKHKDRAPGGTGNARPDFQQLRTGLELAIWLDSTDERGDGPRLEERVRTAVDSHAISRFGGLSLGESTHLVNDVSPIERAASSRSFDAASTYLTADRGRLTLPVWVDHVGSTGTRWSVGNLESTGLVPPETERMPVVLPPESS